jgi:hypothetical protein
MHLFTKAAPVGRLRSFEMLRRSMLPSEVDEWEREKLRGVLWHDAEVPDGTWMPE